MIFFYIFVLGGVVLVIGVWLGTYIGGIVIIRIGYIGIRVRLCDKRYLILFVGWWWCL